MTPSVKVWLTQMTLLAIVAIAAMITDNRGAAFTTSVWLCFEVGFGTPPRLGGAA